MAGARRGGRNGTAPLLAEGGPRPLFHFHAAAWRESEARRALADYVETALEREAGAGYCAFFE